MKHTRMISRMPKTAVEENGNDQDRTLWDWFLMVITKGQGFRNVKFF